eukprot:465874-Pelagomonas_calceolata.AAC.2
MTLLSAVRKASSCGLRWSNYFNVQLMDRCSLSKKPHGTRGLGSFRGKSRQRQGQLLPVWHPHQALLPPPNLVT